MWKRDAKQDCKVRRGEWPRYSARNTSGSVRSRRAAMKPYIIGAICVWLLLGVLGAVMLGQQRVDIGTIVRGPLAFWDGLNKPVDDIVVDSRSQCLGRNHSAICDPYPSRSAIPASVGIGGRLHVGRSPLRTRIGQLCGEPRPTRAPH